MGDPTANAAVEDAIAGAVRTLEGPVRAGYFKPLRLDPSEVALRHNARRRIEAMPDAIIPADEKALILERLKGATIQGKARYAVRNTIIVGAIGRAHERGF